MAFAHYSLEELEGLIEAAQQERARRRRMPRIRGWNPYAERDEDGRYQIWEVPGDEDTYEREEIGLPFVERHDAIAWADMYFRGALMMQELFPGDGRYDVLYIVYNTETDSEVYVAEGYLPPLDIE